MCSGCHRQSDLCQVQVHRVDIAVGQHEGRSLAELRTDRAEDVGRSGALIVRSRGSGTATALVLPFHPASPDGTLGKPRPASRDLVLLADPGLVGEPDFYACRLDLVGRDLCHDVGELFLKTSMTPSTWA